MSFLGLPRLCGSQSSVRVAVHCVLKSSLPVTGRSAVKRPSQYHNVRHAYLLRAGDARGCRRERERCVWHEGVSADAPFCTSRAPAQSHTQTEHSLGSVLSRNVCVWPPPAPPWTLQRCGALALCEPSTRATSGRLRRTPAMCRGSKAKMCRFHVLGTCKNGASCPFSHDNTRADSFICPYFAKGHCAYGDKCAALLHFSRHACVPKRIPTCHCQWCRPCP